MRSRRRRPIWPIGADSRRLAQQAFAARGRQLLQHKEAAAGPKAARKLSVHRTVDAARARQRDWKSRTPKQLAQQRIRHALKFSLERKPGTAGQWSRQIGELLPWFAGEFKFAPGLLHKVTSVWPNASTSIARNQATH
jgi:hypothetical protein